MVRRDGVSVDAMVRDERSLVREVNQLQMVPSVDGRTSFRWKEGAGARGACTKEECGHERW